MTLKTLIVSSKAGFEKAPAVRRQYFEDRLKYLTKYSEIIDQMFAEPWIVDDCLRMSLENRLKWLVTQCETLICKDGDEVVGIGVFAAKGPRSADFIAWVSPEYRKRGIRAARNLLSFFVENILSYAWESLKLVKFETKCCSENVRAIRFAAQVGFRAVGIAHLDYQVQGRLYDSVVFEYLNPAYMIEPVEEREHDGQRQGTEPEPVPYVERDEQPGASELVSEPGQFFSEPSGSDSESGSSNFAA